MAIRFRTLRFRTRVAMILSMIFLIFTIISFGMNAGFTCYRSVAVLSHGTIGCAYTPHTQRGITFHYTMDRGPIIWLPEFKLPLQPNMVVFSFLIPMWCIAPCVLIPTFLIWRKDRIPEGHCQNCGYNLTGNVSGKCPECGQLIPSNSHALPG